jgi:hypothetical protein
MNKYNHYFYVIITIIKTTVSLYKINLKKAGGLEK